MSSIRLVALTAWVQTTTRDPPGLDDSESFRCNFLRADEGPQRHGDAVIAAAWSLQDRRVLLTSMSPPAQLLRQRAYIMNSHVHHLLQVIETTQLLKGRR